MINIWCWPTGQTPLCLLHIDIRLIINSQTQEIIKKKIISHYLRHHFVHFQSNTGRVSVTSADLCREDHWGPRVRHGGALRLGNGHGQPPLLQKELCKIRILQETSGECVIVFFLFISDMIHLHYCNHWRVYFIIVGFFPRSHGFHIPWNERDRGSFPAHTGTRCISLWSSSIPWLNIRRLLFNVKSDFPIFLHPSQTFLMSSSCPEIHGHLHAKELSRKSWKKSYFILRRSGLYFSNKGTSKVRRNKYLYIYISILFILKNNNLNQKRCRQTDGSFILILVYTVNIQAGTIYGLTGKP